VRTLPDVAETLARIEVATVSMESEVALMRRRVDQLDDRMAELHADLAPLSRVAGRFGGRKRKDKQAADGAIELVEETDEPES
jgi:hypothetical protein